MPYDFMTLSPQDFEALACDLLSSELRVPLKQFKNGRDGGIDLRFALTATGTGDLIVQCKRYVTHGFPALLRSLKNELPKLKKLKPKRYVIATTVGLSPQNEQDIFNLLAPWITSINDIFGADALNRIIRDNPTIERRHFKLWISGTAVLQQILHSHIFSQTDASIREIRRTASRLVIHDGFSKALERLNERHHVMIVGNPGIGKTTLARLLLIRYLDEGYEPIWVSTNVEEAWKIVHTAKDANKPCIIVYDDFLGRLSFGDNKFAKNEEISLLRLVDEAAISTNIRLIFTTREYILEEAKQRHGAFDERAQELLKYTLAIEDYARPHRARILFNHLYFSDLPNSRLEKLIKTKLYQQVLGGRHFNPRVIETVCLAANSRSMSDDEFLKYFADEFKNPVSLWQHPYKFEISEIARSILLALWSFDGSATQDSVKGVVRQLHADVPALSFDKQFEDAIRQLDGSFAITERLREWVGHLLVDTISFQNPSVEEFIQSVASTPAKLRFLIPAFTHIDQVLKAFKTLRNQSEDDDLLRMLRNAGQVCEGCIGGKIINGMEQGECRSSRRWSSEGISEISILKLLLEIEIASNVTDSRNKALFNVIVQKKSWNELIVASLSQWDLSGKLEQLISWLSSLQHPIGAKASTIFRRCFFNLVSVSDGLDTRPSNLVSLIQAAELIQGCSNAEVKICLRACEEAIQGVVENEEDAGWVEEEIYAVKRLAIIPKFRRIAISVEPLEDHARELRDNEIEDLGGKTDPVLDNYSRKESINEDELFESLLDR